VPLVARVLSAAQRCVQGVALVLLLCFLGNWLVLTWRWQAIARDLALDSRVRLVHVPSSSVPVSVRCDVVGPRLVSVFVLPGAGASWLFNALPLWSLPQLMNGVELCSYARPGLPLTGGWPVNSTDTEVKLAYELVHKVAGGEKKLPTFIVGHSAGGVLAPLVAKRILDKERLDLRGVVVFDPACAFASASGDETYFAELTAMIKQLRVAEVASSLGVFTALHAKSEEMFAAQLHEVPHTYRDAFLYAAMSQASWSGLVNDLERLNSTVGTLRAAVAAAGAAKLLGDVPVHIVHAEAPRWRNETTPLDALMDAHKTDSLLNSVSTKVQSSTMERADHMFHSSDEVILKTISVVVSAIEPALTALRQSKN
jgi:pimeloyl-ACP methyl ester carboxylesterase